MLSCFSFHHTDPTNKKYDIGKLIASRKRTLLLDELKKCLILCANCHAEVEDQSSDGSSVR